MTGSLKRRLSTLVFGALAVVFLSPSLIDFVRRAATEDPPAADQLSRFDTEIELARRWLDSKKPTQSLVPLERAYKLQPESFAVHNNLCVAYGLLERKEEAVSACQHALRIDPNNQLARNNLGWVSSIKGKEL